MRRGPRGIALAAPAVWLALALGALGAVPAASGAAPPDARYAVVVHSDQSCLGALPSGDRTLLALRFGSTGAAGVPAAAAAAQLHLTPAALQAAELKAVRRLEEAHRAGHCTVATADPTTVAVQGYQATHPAPVGTATTSSGLSWTSPTELALLAIIVLALGALIYGVRRDFGPQRLDRERFGVRRRRDK